MVQAMIEQLPHAKIYIAAFAATLAVAASGAHFGWPSPTLPKLLADDSPLNITDDESSWIVSFMILGAFLGPIPAALLVDNVGRKTTLLSSAVPFIVSWVLIYFAWGAQVLFAARLIAGIGYGMVYTASPMYLGEIASDKVRGSIGTLMAVMSKVGLLIAYCVGPYVSLEMFPIIMMVLPLMFIAIFTWIPESPYYLLCKHREEDALESLERLRGYKDVKAELEKMYETVKQDQENKGTVKQLFGTPGNRRALIIVMGVASCQQLCGSQAVIAYSQKIFADAEGFLGASESTIIFGVVQLVVAAFSSSVIDRLGRRPLLLMSAGGAALTNAGIAAYFYLKDYNGTDVGNFTWVPMAAILIYIIAYTIGLATVPFAQVGELFPTNIKAIATSFFIMFSSILGFTVTKCYQVIADGFGTYVAFCIFTIFTILGLVFIYFVVPETKGKSFIQIQTDLNYKKSVDNNNKV